MRFKHSPSATKLLSNLKGVEIGGSSHNPFGLDTINVDYTDDMDTCYKREEVKLTGSPLPVDIVANGDNLPFKDNSYDFIIHSHVLEHIWNPLAAIIHWMNIIKPNGFLYMIIPDKRRTFDRDNPRTPLHELVNRLNTQGNPDNGHCNIWIYDDLLEICQYLKLPPILSLEVDDKVGNGFTICLQKPSGEAWEELKTHFNQILKTSNT